jgi:hypothetical protein
MMPVGFLPERRVDHLFLWETDPFGAGMEA